MSAPRIILLTRYLASAAQPDSGIGRHMRTLADALAEAGHPPAIVLLPGGQAAAQRNALRATSPIWSVEVLGPDDFLPSFLSRRLNWPLLVLLADLSAAARALPALLRAGADSSRAVIETHSTGFPALFAALLGLPVIVRVSTTMEQLNHERGIRSRWLDLAARLERLHLDSAPALLTHTQLHRDAVAVETGLPAKNFALVPHGLPPAPAAVGLAATDAPPRLLFIGRFERRKGIDLLLAALPGLLARHPRLEVALVGDQGQYPAEVALTPLSPEQRRRVALPGRLDDTRLDGEWRRATIFVAPSRYESFGLMYVEAMARGVPPVGCAVGGVPDVIRDGYDGLLSPPENATALGEVLDRLLSDEPLRRRLAANARASYHERFSAERLASASLALYARFVSARSGVVV